MSKNFTFKIEKAIGIWRSLDPDVTYIKLNKKEIGYIVDQYPYLIIFKVLKNNIDKDRNPNVEWKWIKLNKKFNSLLETKEWLKENFDLLINKYNFYLSD